MKIAGMIVEYNPLHGGHLRLISEARARLGEDTAVIGVMSGNFVQRGDFAIAGWQARARAAVESGVDLVLELPLPWAVASAERFASGGVQVLLNTGLVTHLAFGSECGDAAALLRLAAALESEEFPALLRRELAEGGKPFAAARQRAVERLTSRPEAALLSRPNDILGVEYARALLRQGGDLELLAVPRVGAAHDAPEPEGESASASAIRALLRQGRREALNWMAPAMGRAYEAEEAAGRAPVLAERCERAILARLRTMDEADFAALDQGREGLYRRLYTASRRACSLEELVDLARTKRYPAARLRRMVLWAYLGLRPGELPEKIPYLRPLAMNGTGRALLARMRETAPVLTKPAHVRRLGAEARAVFSLEARAADLYALAYPDLSAAAGGRAWREGPEIL